MDSSAGDADGVSRLVLRDSEPEAVPWLEDNARRRDPAYDEWRSEVLHDRAKKVLAHFLETLLSEGAQDHEALAEYLATDFAGAGELRPAELSQVFDDGTTRVLRRAASSSSEGSVHPRDELFELGRALRAPFDEAGLEHVHPHPKIVSVDLAGENAFTTSAIVYVDAVSATGGIQQNMEWRLDWSVEPAEGEGDERVRIRSVVVTSFEEVHARQPLLAELTEHVFGSYEGYASEILSGVEHYQDRTDKLIGSSFLGMQGLAIGDVDGDGADDVFVAQQAGLPNLVLLAGPDGRVVDATERSNLGLLEVTRSALLIDWDDDGDQDFVGAVGGGILSARNEGGGVFRNIRHWAASDPSEIYSMSAADADGDGDLDVYCCRYAERGILYAVPTPYHDANNGAKNVFFRNDGDRFTEATAEVGLDENNRKFSLASVWEDYDGDGDLDLYVANDFGRNNLYRNDGTTFTDVAEEVGADDMSAGMGISSGDVDLDGDTDFYVTNMFSSAGLRIASQADRFMSGEHQEVHGHYTRHARGNSLLLNTGDGRFEDATVSAGVAVGGWAWGAKFVDLNGDGLEDLYSPNGFVTNPDLDDL